MLRGRLEALAAFTTAAREGSFAGAGRKLGLSRDQISKQVGALEGELGARLFRRTTRALQLTPAGAAYLERVEPLLAQLEEAIRALDNEDRATGPLTVSAPATFATRVLMPALPDFLGRHPGLEVRLRLEDRMLRLPEDVDISVRIADAIDTDFAIEAVGTIGRICTRRNASDTAPCRTRANGCSRTGRGPSAYRSQDAWPSIWASPLRRRYAPAREWPFCRTSSPPRG